MRSTRSPPRTVWTCCSSVRWICRSRSVCRCSSTAPSSSRPPDGCSTPQPRTTRPPAFSPRTLPWRQAMSICAPNFLHAEIGVAAAEAGKHFWIEKPVGRSLEETARIEAAATKAGVITSIGYNYRHAPAVEHARTLIAAGKLGRITNVRAAFFSGYANEPKGALSWRLQRRLGRPAALGDPLWHARDPFPYVVRPLRRSTPPGRTVFNARPPPPLG